MLHARRRTVDETLIGPMTGTERPAILAEGRNCWRLDRARRASLLTNADYFRWLAHALKRARQRILLIGWDLDMALVLDPHGAGPEALPLKDFLAALLVARPGLEIRCLLWDRTIFYGGNRLSAEALDALDAGYAGFGHHFAAAPLFCSHHAKLVVVDDSLAFVGGIDLAGDRWDRGDHPPFHPDRITPAGDAYGPVHDLQMLVGRPAAANLAEYAVRRWRRATGERLAGIGPERAAWPDGLAADFEEVPTGIARTMPAGSILDGAGPAVREVAALNRDALAAARRSIYLEAQYLASAAVGDSLVRQLERPDGAEIVIVVTRTSHGLLERLAMGTNRDRLLRRLAAADRHGRLRVYYPTVSDRAARVEVKIHAKLMVIDDRLLRVGSSNLNNRSLAVDTECDLAVEAAVPAHRACIRRLRNRLIAEQLHQPIEMVEAAFRTTGSLIAVIERLNGAGYLQPLTVAPGPEVPMAGTAVFDPSEPPSLRGLGCRFGLDGMPPLDQFGGDEQQASDGERD